MPRVALIDYGSGNLRSAAKALEHVAVAEDIVVTRDAATVAAADRIILPGVGAFGDCYRGLAALPNMIDALEDAVLRRRAPFLGICVGMQLLAERGFEHGEHRGLGWVTGDVVPLAPQDPALKVPHMGWNELNFSVSHPLLAGIEPGDHAYFVHSYHMQAKKADEVVVTTNYGGAVTAMIVRANIVGTQFHPEKSQRVGLQILRNFLDWKA